MSDEKATQNTNSTLPPPAADEDPYTEPTVVGQASAELLALVRAATDDAKPFTAEAKLNALKDTASRSAKEAATREVARETAKAASLRPPTPSSPPPGVPRPTASAALSGGTRPAASTSAPPGVPRPASKPPSPALRPTSSPPTAAPPARSSSTADVPPSTTPAVPVRVRPSPPPSPPARHSSPPRETAPGSPLPPALSIALLFAAIAFTLAVIVR